VIFGFTTIPSADAEPPLSSADLSVTKTASPDPVEGGQELEYRITVTNDGPSDATNITLTDILPDTVLFTSAITGQWICTGPDESRPGGTITCTRDTLPSGSSDTIVIYASPPGTGGTLNNTVTVSANEADPDTTNNTASASTTLTAPAVNLPINDTTPGYYNNALGTVLDGTQPEFPPADSFDEDDPTIFPAEEPDLSSAADVLGDWLTADPLPLNSNWSGLQSIPPTWDTNTETAIIYLVDAGPNPVANLRGNFGVDNGIFVWVNGEFRFGALAPGKMEGLEYTDIDLGSLNPGLNYIQILREDHSDLTGFTLEIAEQPESEPTITLDPIEGPPSTEVTATGSGWPAGHEVSVQWEDGRELATPTVDGNGDFTVSFTVPDDAAEGEHTIDFVGFPPEGEAHVISAIFTVEAQPTITLDPIEGPPGTEVTVQGSGWIPGDTVFLQFVVNMEEDGSYTEHTIWYDVGEAPVGDDGTFTTTFTVPAEAKDLGVQKVIAGTFEESWLTDAPFHVKEEVPSCPEPTVTLSDSFAKHGDTITIQGKGWLPGGTVTFTMTGPEHYDIASIPVPESGEWGINLHVVDATPPGNYELGFSEDHEGCKQTVVQPFTIESVADTEPPTVSWVKPVGTGESYPATSGTVELEVAVSDNAGIQSVEFIAGTQ
jgi:uncharacterized repeat protein (TIGR01451 family)